MDEAVVRSSAVDLVAEFGSHDTAAYFGAFAPGTTFVFHTTGERPPDRAAYERPWRRWETADGCTVQGCESSDAAVQLLGDAAVFVHDVTTDLELDGARETVRERETIVFERRGSGRLAVHEHLSPRPDQEEKA